MHAEDFEGNCGDACTGCMRRLPAIYSYVTVTYIHAVHSTAKIYILFSDLLLQTISPSKKITAVSLRGSSLCLPQ